MINNAIIEFNYALIGCYLVNYGVQITLQFISWLGVSITNDKCTALSVDRQNNQFWSTPKSPLLQTTPDAINKLNGLLTGYEHFEKILQYSFRDRSYLLHAMATASFATNDLTEGYVFFGNGW